MIEQESHKLFIAAAKNQLRTATFALNILNINLNSTTNAVIFARNLLTLRYNSDSLAKLNSHNARLNSLNCTDNNRTDFILKFRQDNFTLSFAQTLQDHLLSSLSRNSTKSRHVMSFHHNFTAKFSRRIYFLSFLQVDLIGVILNFFNNSFNNRHDSRTVIDIQASANQLVTCAIITTPSRRNRLLNHAQNCFFWQVFFLSNRTHCQRQLLNVQIFHYILLLINYIFFRLKLP